ncbi:MAG: valine--tRNA ligase [Candidatus Tyloplasma litorale]|nr:MAG: valine--tRNA ligase [Mycoplasmatales bacterium]
MENNKYNPSIFEKEIQKFWKENNYFKAKNKGKKSFSIIMPPPNVTGKLHLGHAWDSYYPDMLIRYKQLNDFDSVWYPGMDHAGIATQAKVEQKIFFEEGKNRFDLGREEFIKKVFSWKDFYSENIQKQWNKLGIAADFDKMKFTLDKDVNDKVLDVFIELYNKKLIYKGKRLINWDCKLMTAISNIEIKHEIKESKIYNIKYFFENSDDFVIVSTTRPETMFADVALFVNPNDPRYQNKIGKIVINPANNEKLKIMADKYVDIEFGTGVLKVTPGHDFNDYNLSKKYNLKIINILNKNGTLNELCGKFSGMEILEARKKFVSFLNNKNFIESINDHKKSIGISERSGAIIEPMISEQWFLNSSNLAKKSKNEQNNQTKKVDFYPKRFENIYLSWLETMEDWCISRQLWWGHRIPAWYKNGKILVQKNSPGKDWKQDEDVLDTWFSSALWPWILKDEKLIKKSENPNYLSDLLFTGYDIILFWVSRMIYQSLEIDGRPPFKKAIIHGLIRDKKGQKMSKSLNNGIDPMEVISKWGSDSLRSFLLGNSTPGQDIKYNESKIESAWNLNNKLYNSKNLLLKLSKNIKLKRLDLNKMKLSKIDEYILFRIENFKKILQKNIEIYNLTIIFNEMNKLIFDDFANNYLEFVKQEKNNNAQIENSINIFLNLLIIIHPLIPFVTEKIYQELSKRIKTKKSILLERYKKIDIEEKEDSLFLLSVLKVARKINSQPNFVKNDYCEIFIETEKNYDVKWLNKYLFYLNAGVNKTKLKEYFEIDIFPGVGIIYSTYNNAKNKSIDLLKQNISKKINFELKRANSILQNKKFVENANPELIQKEKEKLIFYNESLNLIK